MPEHIIKRDGRKTAYTLDKIAKAIYKAARSVGGDDYEEAEQLAEKVDARIRKTIIGRDPSVEEIQDIVERVLIDEGHAKTAKAYILYRAERTRVRESNVSLMKTFEDLTFSAAIDSDVKRENANINGDTAMGTMLKYGSEGAKKFNQLNVLDPKHAKGHANGDYHIHDFDFYMLTTTCCQIDLIKLFEKGFSTGHGFLRTPNSIQSYAALACIAIQSNQNDQHGGQSIPNFDYAMADGVRKTFASNYTQNLVRQLMAAKNTVNDAYPVMTVNAKHIRKTIKTDCDLAPAYGDEDFDGGYYLKERELVTAQIIHPDDKIGDADLIKIQKRAHAFAKFETETATYQAMEALVHNLNTMNSRAGAQVPFSSINYGTDISHEGRLAIKCLLQATQAGLGNGETPIFPVQIFKVKSGVNYNFEDPNYDLFRLAMETSAKRMFPNFSFLDAPFNLQFYKPGDYNTEVSYMGCVERSETVSYRIGDDFYCEGIGRAYDRLEKLYGGKTHGVSAYIDLKGKPVKIWDGNKSAFVQVKKWIKNPDRHNWLNIKLSNGRCLTATKDHPLPTESKGRVHAGELTLSDRIPVNYDYRFVNFKEDEENAGHMPIFVPWFLGMLLCDSSYANNITLSLGADETDLIERIESCIYVLRLIGDGMIPNFEKAFFETSKILQQRGKKGTYYDINIKGGEHLKTFRDWLTEIFEGVRKSDRHVPNMVFSWPEDQKLAFLAGMIDADGYINPRTGYVQIGSTNKELALQQMMLAQQLGMPAKCYQNHYNSKKDNIRVRVEFKPTEELIELIVSGKKRKAYEKAKAATGTFDMQTPEFASIEAIESVEVNDFSFDVETESDRFDVSGILSHNCRTRVMGNVYDPSRETTSGRGNLSFTTINLPRLGIEAHGDMDAFYSMLDDKMKEVCGQLMHRFEIIAQKTPRNFPFLMGQGVWMDSDRLDIDEPLEEILKHGTLSVGFIGLAETLVALTGKHHGEDETSQKLGLEIISHMRSYLDDMSKRTRMNFTLLATPAEGLSGRFIAIDKKRYGEIPGITDKDFYTNSFHVPVYYNISAFKKIRIEGPYHALTNAGHISYIELDGDPSKNIAAFESIIRCMHDNNIGYGAINHPIDRDPVCGFNGIIDDTCPCCGRAEHTVVTERIKRPKSR